jgi:DHA1 family purine ribonucleoside efflux pump-like MFS transporter
MEQAHPTSAPASTLWGAVYAVTFSVGAIITSEMLPASQLTPIARDLAVSAGTAGQSITATAAAAIVTSLAITRVIGSMDRRRVLLVLSALMTASNLLSALAPSFAFLALARVLLGMSLGGFWSLAPSIALRLARPAQVPKALAIIYSGISVALVVAMPLGTFIGSVIGWRGVFGLAAVIGAVCWLWQRAALPPMEATLRRERSGILAIVGRPQVLAGMLATFCVFGGRFAFFNYMRPFFEQVTHLNVTALSTVLLVFSVATFFRTTASGLITSRSLRATLLLGPVILLLSAAGLLVAGPIPVAAAVLTAVWGFANGMVPVGWSTWITRTLPDAAESGGSLQVAVIQFSNIAGSAVGGVALDWLGPRAPLMTASVLFVLAAAIVGLRLRVPSNRPAAHPQIRRQRGVPGRVSCRT